MTSVLRIGNAQGFWGDSADAPARLVAQQPDLDYLTLDYLAEVSMSILAVQRERKPALGYAGDFIRVVEALAPFWKRGSRLRLVTNAGGLNPAGCATACAEALRKAGAPAMKIGVVSGDDVLPVLRAAPGGYANLETREPIGRVRDSLVTANAYIGAAPVVEALRHGAQIVITGRVADPSLTVAPCIFHHGWKHDDYRRIAGATIAGHLIECGAQVTGGICTDWLDIPDPANIGFPVVEVDAEGVCVVTKPRGTGGRVNEQTVKEQLVYEIGDPANYLSPDATVSFLSLRVTDEGSDRVCVSGAIGSPPPSSYKVSATYRAGFRAAGMLTVFGRDAVVKARRCGQIVYEKLKQAGSEPEHWNVECLGGGDAVGGVAGRGEGLETVLRMSVADPSEKVVERFTREVAPLVTSGPQGVTGYAEGRPRVHEVFGYWPCLIDRNLVDVKTEIIEG